MAVLACLVVSHISLIAMLGVAFLIALGCGISSPLLLGLSLYQFPDLAGAGSALQGTIKMAGSALTLWMIALFKPTDFIALMLAIFILTLISLMLRMTISVTEPIHVVSVQPEK